MFSPVARQYVIVGSGPAGIAAAEAIRRLDQSGRITVVSEEPYYSRPGLAYHLTGELPETQLFPFTDIDFEHLHLERFAVRATALYPDAHQLQLADGRRLVYDRLLIATGAQAARLTLPGGDCPGVVKLDNLEDARSILRLARKGRTAVVVGGGITALEIVEGLAAQRMRVHYFLRGGRYWSNVLDESESRLVERTLMAHGVQLHFHTELAGVMAQQGHLAGVQTQDGRSLACHLLAVAIGVQPRLELAQTAGLQIARGVLVNDKMEASATDVFAAGDVAQVYDPASGKYMLDSLWSVAREQGDAAGRSMTGAPVTYRKPVAFNVTRLAGLTTTIIGAVGGGEDADLAGIARGDSETWRQLPDAILAQSGFDVNRLRLMVGQQTLLGAVVMGDQTLSLPLQALVRHQVDITPIRSQLLQPDAPLADLIIDFWKGWKQSEGRHAG